MSSSSSSKGKTGKAIFKSTLEIKQNKIFKLGTCALMYHVNVHDLSLMRKTMYFC